MDIDITDSQISFLQEELLTWFDINGRHWIPWKLKSNGAKPMPGENISTFGIWIAEVMLQQTQVKVVIPFWKKLMLNFPSLKELALANDHDLLIIWQGLGYYSRVRRLKKTANLLIDLIEPNDPSNSIYWPKDLSIWMSFPGIGRTTAGGILSSSFDLPFPILDGNIKRILSRLFAINMPLNHQTSKLWILSEKLLQEKRPRDFNQALMDLGSLVCTPKNPNCSLCPWKSYCVAYATGSQTKYPLKILKKPIPTEVIGLGVLFNSKGQVLIDQRLNEGVLAGLWEFPGGKQEEGESIQATIARELKEELGVEVLVKDRLISFDHSFSHKKLHFIVHICQLLAGHPKPLASQKVLWVKCSELNKYPFPAANKTIISSLLDFVS